MPIDLEGEIAKAIAEGGINDDLSDREWPQLHEVRKAQYRRLAGAVLARLDALGLVVVPKEPTEEMVEAGNEHLPPASVGDEDSKAVADAWGAMIDAAP